MHRFAGAVAALTATVLLTLLAVADSKPSGSAVIPLLTTVFVLAGLYWVATTETARSLIGSRTQRAQTAMERQSKMDRALHTSSGAN
jgi:energy-converting hydrogenase Eha subunit B